MTKEEYYDFPRSDYLNTIDKIFDDFRSRRCENCEYLARNGTCGTVYIDNHINVIECFGEDFGCNKFERKKL